MNDGEAWSLPPNPATLCPEEMSGHVYLLHRQYLGVAKSSSRHTIPPSTTHPYSVGLGDERVISQPFFRSGVSSMIGKRDCRSGIRGEG